MSEQRPTYQMLTGTSTISLEEKHNSVLPTSLTGTYGLNSIFNDRSSSLYFLSKRIDEVYKRVDRVESIKVKEFKDNDVYEINKQIERLDLKIALLQSNQRGRTLTNAIFLVMSINSVILGVILWWLIYA